MADIDHCKMDKSHFSVTTLNDDCDEVEYWRSKTPQERREAVELMRRINYGEDACTARLQRVLEVAQRLPS
jgi:hypothetical protein